MASIQMIPYEDSGGELREIYDWLIKSRKKLANVHKIHSLNPPMLVDHMQLYLTVMFKKSPLKRYQREMMSVIVSAANQCPYCIAHHEAALKFYWKDEQKVGMLKVDYEQLNLSDIDKVLCDYAHHLTLHPEDTPSPQIQQMKALGLSDRAIHDATMVIAYFNFVNRIVQGLAVEEEVDTGGFNY